MKIIISGATGLAGSEVLKEALADSSIEQVTVLSRSPLEASHPKLRKIVLSNFLDYSHVLEEIQNHDACLWCLGVSQIEVTKEKYIEITFDYTIAAAKAFFSFNPNLRFCFLSGQGGDQSENSKRLYSRIKGRTEKELLELSKNVFCFRPSLIIPTKEGLQKLKPLRRFVLSIFIVIYAFISFFAKSFKENLSITTKELALSMIKVAKNGNEKSIFENKAIIQNARGKFN